MQPLRLCLVHGGLLTGPLRELGHEVLELNPAPGILHIAPELEKHGFSPDALIQTEVLGQRTWLADLPSLDCLAVFRSLDTHINGFWQRHYARLFDAALTTQPHLQDLFREADMKHVGVLAWSGFPRPCPPFSTRPVPVGFVGRVTEHRPLRANLAAFLQERFQADIRADIPAEDMFRFYESTRIAPNDALMREVNKRFFETPSCGCLSVTPDLGPALDNLLEPGKEILVYNDVLELESLTDFHLRHEKQAEAMAMAAYKHIQAAHLPIHRARELVRFLDSVSPDRPGAQAASLAWWLTMFQLWRAQISPLDAESIASGLERHAHAHARAALLELRLSLGRDTQVAESLGKEAKQPRFQSSLAYNLAAASAALRLKAFDTAKHYLRRQQPDSSSPPPRKPAELLLAFAKIALRHNRPANPGLPFDPARLFPACATDCLVWAHELSPSRLDIPKLLGQVLESVPGSEHLKLATLSHLTLHYRGDWRLTLRLAISNLKAYRRTQGLEELHTAHTQAQNQNKLSSLHHMLANASPTALAILKEHESATADAPPAPTLKA